jgi:hypothetical protein
MALFVHFLIYYFSSVEQHIICVCKLFIVYSLPSQNSITVYGMGSVIRMNLVGIRIAHMKAQQKNWKWKVKCSLKNGAPIFLRVKVRFILLTGSAVVT